MRKASVPVVQSGELGVRITRVQSSILREGSSGSHFVRPPCSSNLVVSGTYYNTCFVFGQTPCYCPVFISDWVRTYTEQVPASVTLTQHAPNIETVSSRRTSGGRCSPMGAGHSP